MGIHGVLTKRNTKNLKCQQEFIFKRANGAKRVLFSSSSFASVNLMLSQMYLPLSCQEKKVFSLEKALSVCRKHHWCEWIQSSSTDLKNLYEIEWFGGVGSIALNFIDQNHSINVLESDVQKCRRWPARPVEAKKNCTNTYTQATSIKTNCQKRAMDDLSVTLS